MLWRRSLDEILGSRAKVRVLRTLWNSSLPLSGREIARRAGVSHTGALKAIEELHDLRVVLPASDVGGPRHRLNRSHELVRRGIGPLFEREESLEARMTDLILATVPDALCVVLFGSVARGSDDLGSDLDVLVVVPDGLEPDAIFDELAALDTRLRFGKDLGPVVWDRSTLVARAEEGSALLRSILEHGRVLAGESPLMLLSRRTDVAAGQGS